MKLTCLSAGRNYDFPACHLLQMCGVRMLLECPLDLSSLQLFLPVYWSSRRQMRSVSFPSGNCSSDDLPRAIKQCKTDEMGEDSLFKLCGDSVLIDAEPWYKTADLHLWDLSLIEVVLVSTPAGMLGLPFLTSNKNFSAKIYATEATAKVGQLLMEELVAMHSEYAQLYGPSESMLPLWLDCTKLESASTQLREIVLGKDGSEIGNWHRLYSAADVIGCMAKVHSLRYAEEVCYNDTLIMKPVSSGLEIGSSNWIVTGLTRSLAYLTGSVFDMGHAMGLDIPALQGNDLILFSDFSSLSSINQPPEAKDARVKCEKDNPNDPTNSFVSKFRYKFPVYWQRKSSAGSSNAQGLQTSSISFSACHGMSSVGMVGSSKSQASETLVSSSISSKDGKSIGIEPAKASSSVCVTTEREKSILICDSMVKTIAAGGSVLIPMTRMGITLQLLEEISAALQSASLGQVPMFYISPTMEETLAFANTIPEWLSKQRQEKLYVGEDLFGHIALMKEKRLHAFRELHSTQLVDAWQEPCVVVAPHWSLRSGPVVHLLHRWHQNPSCLLVIVEHMIDIELALSPFKPIAMQLLQNPFSSGLRFDEIAPVMKKLQPKLVLFPEALQKGLPNIFLKEQSFLLYQKGQTLRIPSLKDHIEVGMATDLAFQLRPKQVGQGKITGARLKAELHIQDGRLYLKSGAPLSSLMPSSNQQCRWGVINPDVLLLALREQGICATVEDNVTSQILSEGKKESNINIASFVVNISSPSKATIEVNGKHTVIKADDAIIRHRILEVVNSILYVI